MIMYRRWKQRVLGGLKIYVWDGWFLFGFLPLYIRKRIL